MTASRLALGTVQFGQSYGVSNKFGEVPLDEVIRVLDLARLWNVDLLDTATAYGDSEKKLGEAGVNGFKIVTKLSSMTVDAEAVHVSIDRSIESSLSYLGVNSLHGVLIHNPSDLRAQHGKKILDALLQQKADGVIKKIGISIYNPQELEWALGLVEPDIIQCPFNVFDRRIERSGWLNILHKNGVELHARSIFLQGLLLMPRNDVPKKFDRWSSILDRWSIELQKNGLSAVEACIRFALSKAEFKKVLVGVESCQQFAEILAAISASPCECDWDSLSSEEDSLINPSLW